MGRYSVKRYKTKRRTRDLDLIFKDLSSKESIEKLKNQPLDETKPGLGQYYCIHCAKYFETNIALITHLKGKIHKRRAKELSERPYTQDESNAAASVDLLKFMKSVEKYKNENEKRKFLETDLLGDKQIQEYKLRDELKATQAVEVELELKEQQAEELLDGNTTKKMDGEIEMV